MGKSRSSKSKSRSSGKVKDKKAMSKILPARRRNVILSQIPELRLLGKKPSKSPLIRKVDEDSWDITKDLIPGVYIGNKAKVKPCLAYLGYPTGLKGGCKDPNCPDLHLRNRHPATCPRVQFQGRCFDASCKY